MLKKLWNGIIGKPETEKPVTSTNAVDAKKELRDAIVKYFTKSFLSQKNFTDTVVVWISDIQQEYQSYIRNGEEEFKTDLCTELDNRQLNAISKAKIEFKTENPPQEFTKIAEGVYIQLLAEKEKTEKPKDIHSKAKITVVKGKGSLMKSKYSLDAGKQTEYKIGSSLVTDNDIVINYNDPQYPENQQVSRHHAKIVFVANKGFALESLKSDNRTFIHRNGKREYDIYLNDGAKLLKHNDIIELGKSVCLKFEIIADNIETK